MENNHAPGIISQNQIGGKHGRRTTPFGKGGPVFIGRWNEDEQPALAGYRNNKEEIIHG